MARLKMFDLDNPRTPTQRGWKTTLSNESGFLRRHLGFDGFAYGAPHLDRATDAPRFEHALECLLQSYYCPADVHVVAPAAGGARVVSVSARLVERHEKAVWLMKALGFEQVPGHFQWYRLHPAFTEAGNRI